MLQAYFDESGTHDGSDVCTLAGYFGGVRQWCRFETQWKKVLENNGVEKFHARRFWARNPEGRRVDEYEDWSDDQAETFIRDLLVVIQAHRIFPIGSAVLMRDWLALPEYEKRYLTGGAYDHQRGKFTTSGAPSKTYFLPFLFAIQKACDYCKAGLKVHFSFDRNAPYCGYALDYFRAIGEMGLNCSSKMGDILFSSSIESPPVQAADLLAYQTYQYGKQRWAKGREIDMPPIVLELLQRIRSRRDDFKLFDKDAFDIILKEFRISFLTPGP